MRQLEEELTKALEKTTPDVITFSGMGEPTLAENMDGAIELIRRLTNLPLAILTNSSLLYDKYTEATRCQQLFLFTLTTNKHGYSIGTIAEV